MTDHEILTLEEVAKYLRVSERTVYEWANRGEIPCGKLGTNWRFRKSDVETWLNKKLGSYHRPPRLENVTLREVLVEERVVSLQCDTKAAALNALVDVLSLAPEVRDGDELRREVFEREELMSTGIGFGIGVPHVRLASVDNLVMAVGVNSADLLDYASLDEKPVRIICMVAARDNQHAQYLKTLAAISTQMKESTVREALLAAKTPREMYHILTTEG